VPSAADEVRHWVALSDGDLAAARDLLATGHAAHAVFCCQQTVEKRLKALYLHRHGTEVPRTHNLVALAARLGLDLDESRAAVLADLARLYVASRYPDNGIGAALAQDLDRARALSEAAEEMARWLDSLLSM